MDTLSNKICLRTANEQRRTDREGFTLVEILIVVAILGILAAVVLPAFSDHVTQAKSAAAKDNLRILRNAIELYAAQHNGVAPGYQNNDSSTTPSLKQVNTQLLSNTDYLGSRPENPFNEQTTVKVIGNNAEIPAEPIIIDLYGWVYKPATKTIKLNWPGTDSKGVAYYDY